MAKKAQKNEEFTEKQIKFVYFYCSSVDKNAAEAARKAGYSEKTAKQKASALLKDKKVRALIHAQEQLKAIEKEVNPEKSGKVNAKDILEHRIEILMNCKKKVPLTQWDYKKHQMVVIGEKMLDPRSASVVLRDIEESLDEKDSGWTSEEKDKIYALLSR